MISLVEMKKKILPGYLKYLESKDPGKSLNTYKTYASDSNYLINNGYENLFIKFVRAKTEDKQIKDLIESILITSRGKDKVPDGGAYYYEKLCWLREYIQSIGGIDALLEITPSNNRFTSWHVGVAAEAIAAAQFARCGIAVSVQYGADQPEYDLVAVEGDKLLKISVKGSKDGGWGLTQSYKKGRTYHEAIDAWLEAHGKKTIFCLVQFNNTKLDDMPRVYLATPSEIAEVLHKTRNGNGETILYEYKKWTSRSKVASGFVDKIPEEWLFTEERARYMLEKYAN